MPTLGFLKKKRTKESPGITSPATSSQATSPITPTSSRGFDNSIASISTQSTLPQSHEQEVLQTTTSRTTDQPTAVGKKGSMAHGLTPQQQSAQIHSEQQQHRQNSPSISNLIHPPQHDGASQSYPTPPISSQPSLHPGAVSTTLQMDASQRRHSQQSQQQPQIRQTKGKYSLTDFEIQRTLGTGSFGRVHLVQSKHNQRYYAVKVLKKAQVHKMKQVEHTNDERKMLQEVKHPFLITLWGTFQDSKNLYMVMDFVEGGELFSLLRKSQVCSMAPSSCYILNSFFQRFPNPVAKFYAAEVTLALEYLHSKQIIYRDLKPENLLLDRHGHLKITDFGFAKKVPDITWTLCGTPDYLAPEVVSSKGYNKSVDW
ncbi:cAMP-dependent protein kinase catalytic subunit [Ciborinia camelliae]|nr:cAMP-dependent protein kinase catalytic subunit [Ciborinia camelliae]